MPAKNVDADGLDDDERELIQRLRRQKREEADQEIWIKDGDREARMPYGKGVNWLRKHGFLLDDEETAPEPEPEPEEAEDDKPKGTRFGGRRIA